MIFRILRSRVRSRNTKSNRSSDLTNSHHLADKPNQYPLRNYSVTLYHGSNTQFKKPLVELSELPCDFGKGFYTTGNLDKARLRAKEKSGKKNEHYVMEFVFSDELTFGKLKVLRLEPDEWWVRFVMDNRTELYSGPKYDLIIGPSADGNTAKLEKRYVKEVKKGKVNYDRYLRKLKPGIYGEQWVFTSQQAVDEFIRLNHIHTFR